MIPYLDDIIVYSESIAEHQIHIETVMGKLKAAGIALNEAKCRFYRKEVKILGNIVSYKIIKPDLSKIEAIREYGEPIDIKQLRSFLGLANYVRDFVSKFSEIANSLTEMLKGKDINSKMKILWNPKAREAFKVVKKAIVNATFRTHLVFSKEFI